VNNAGTRLNPIFNITSLDFIRDFYAVIRPYLKNRAYFKVICRRLPNKYGN